MEPQSDYLLINDKEDNEINVKYDVSTQLRLGFIRKVYGILSTQLVLTVLMCLLSMISTSFHEFQMKNTWLLILTIIVSIALPCSALCFPNLIRKSPDNYIFLSIFTFCEAYLVSFICGMYNARLVFMAAFMTAAMVISLTVYALTTKTDFTLYGGTLFIVGTSVLMFSLFAMFTNNKIVHIILSTVWIVVFGIYLLYDTQLIIGRKEHAIGLDDYILASLMLYLDIINIFLYMLRLLSLLSGGER